MEADEERVRVTDEGEPGGKASGSPETPFRAATGAGDDINSPTVEMTANQATREMKQVCV